MQKIRLEDADYIELVMNISYGKSSEQMPAGTIFSSIEAALQKFNQPIQGKYLPDPYNRGKKLQIPLVTEKDIRQWIEIGAVKACKLVEGRVVHASLERPAPTPIGMSNSIVDENGKEIPVEPKPNRTDVMYGFNPENLKGRDIDELNTLVKSKDKDYFVREGAFDDAQEAIAFLSQDFLS